jgi:hypothetical protein
MAARVARIAVPLARLATVAAPRASLLAAIASGGAGAASRPAVRSMASAAAAPYLLLDESKERLDQIVGTNPKVIAYFTAS